MVRDKCRYKRDDVGGGKIKFIGEQEVILGHNI